MSKGEWLTAREIAEAKLPGLPATKRKVNALAKRQKWQTHRSPDGEPLARKRPGREGGGGWEYHRSLLPDGAQLTLHVLKNPPPPKPMPTEPNGDVRWLIINEAARFAAAQDLPQFRADTVFAEAYNNRKLDFDDAIYTLQRKLSTRTLQRWRALLGNGTSRKRAKRRPLLETALGGEVKTYIAALITERPHLSADHVRLNVMKKFGPTLDGKPMPSLRSFQAFITRWRDENKQLFLRLTDPDGYKNRYRVAGQSRDQIERLNQLWEIDASPADVMTTDGRYSLYVCIDLYSRRIVTLLSKTAKAEAVLGLLRKAVMTWGVPEIIRIDNGSDFKANRVRIALAGLGIETDICSPYTPEQKGVVERAIGTVQRDLMPLLPGFIGHNVADRKAIEARKSFAARHGESPDKALCVELTADQVQHNLDWWAKERYAHRPHAALKSRGKTPFLAAANWRGKIRAIENERALDVLLAPIAGSNGIRKVGRQGVRANNALFIAPDVMAGTKVLVRFDPADMGRVWLFSPDGTEFLAEAICPERQGIDPEAVYAVAKATQKRVVNEVAGPIRRAARAIKPEHVIEAVLSGDGSAGSLAAFPQPSEVYETGALRAAAQSQESQEYGMHEREQTPEEQARHQQFVAEHERRRAEEEAARAERARRQQETPKQRFRRFLGMRDRHERGETMSADQLRWMGQYQTTAEYRSHCRMLADFGEEWLYAGDN